MIATFDFSQANVENRCQKLGKFDDYETLEYIEADAFPK